MSGKDITNSNEANTKRGPLFMIGASLCWSLGGLCISFIPWGPMSIIGIRALLGAIVLVISQRSLKIKFSKGNIIAALCLSVTTILFVFANKLTTAAAAILLQYSAPIFIILVELIFYKKKPKLSEILVVSVTLMGMLLFFADKLGEGNMLGNILAIISGMSYAGVFVCNNRKDVDTKEAILLGFIINVTIGLPFAFFQVTADLTAWIFMLILGIVQVGLAYICFSEGIKHTSALLACLITAMEPILNPLWVALVIGEIPGVFSIIGGVIILLAIGIYNLWLEKRNII